MFVYRKARALDRLHFLFTPMTSHELSEIQMHPCRRMSDITQLNETIKNDLTQVVKW